jgi:hypothetical protein
MSKMEFRKAGKKGQHTSLHTTVTYDLENEKDRYELFGDGGHTEPKEKLINDLTSEIDRQLEFISRKIGKEKPLNNRNIDFAKLHSSIMRNKTLDTIPYLRLASSCAWRLDSVRYDLLHREVDPLAVSMTRRMMEALVDATMCEIADYEDRYLAGRARAEPANERKISEKERLKELVTPWKEEYEKKGLSQQQIVEKISKRLEELDEKRVDKKEEPKSSRSPATIAGWFGFSKNLK